MSFLKILHLVSVPVSVHLLALLWGNARLTQLVTGQCAMFLTRLLCAEFVHLFESNGSKMTQKVIFCRVVIHAKIVKHEYS